jgi:hypothetical protein
LEIVLKEIEGLNVWDKGRPDLRVSGAEDGQLEWRWRQRHIDVVFIRCCQGNEPDRLPVGWDQTGLVVEPSHLFTAEKPVFSCS